MFSLKRLISPLSEEQEEILEKLLEEARNGELPSRRVIGRTMTVDPREMRNTKEFQDHLKWVRENRALIFSKNRHHRDAGQQD